MNGDFPILRHYLAIMREQEDAPIAVLHIGADHTLLVWGDEPEKYGALLLAVGSRKTAGDHFRHSPPLPVELENAIAAVEDEIMCRHVTFAMRPTLYSVDPALIDLARLAGVSGETLSVETVEGLYERWLPSAWEGRPPRSSCRWTRRFMRPC